MKQEVEEIIEMILKKSAEIDAIECELGDYMAAFAHGYAAQTLTFLAEDIRILYGKPAGAPLGVKDMEGKEWK